MTIRLFRGLLAAAIASAAAWGTMIGAQAYELERHTQAEIKDMYKKMYFDLHDVPQYSEEYSTEYPTYAGKLTQDTLDEALDELEKDHDYLTAGGVFPKKMLELHIARKRQDAKHVTIQPSPMEFQKYYDL